MQRIAIFFFLLLGVFACGERQPDNDDSRKVSSVADSLIFKYLYRNSDSAIIMAAYREEPFIDFEKYVHKDQRQLDLYKLGYRENGSETVLGYILLDTPNNRLYECNSQADSLVEWYPDLE